MKAKDLLSKLSSFDPEIDVLCFCEDDQFATDNHIFRIFEITGIEKVDAEKIRGVDQFPSLRLGKTGNSTPHALLEITLDF